MTRATATVLRPGLLTTIQDRGRYGWQAMGVPVGGPMDEFSFRLANRIVGNEPSDAGLEITLTGPELRFDRSTMFAVTGAELDVDLDGRAVAHQTANVAPAGSRLSLGACRRGVRAYLALAGGVTSPVVFGSRATHLPSGLGGLEGRALRTGDRLPLGRPASMPSRRLPMVPDRLPTIGPVTIRAMRGPQDWAFTDEALAQFVDGTYELSRASNRMGYRLSGPRLTHRAGADIISDAVTFGSIQVPADGQPILLMADRQTSGGYAKIATVISADLGLAAQLQPGDTLRFEWCTLDEALAALIELEQVLL